jgi:hypothetical protein
LFLGDDKLKNGFESKSNDLGDNFVDDIAECYWPEMLRVGNSFLIVYEGEKSGIYGRENLARSSGFLY